MLYKLADGKTIDDVLGAISENRVVYALEQTDQQYHLVRADQWDPGKHTLGAYRPVEPLKTLVFRPREFLGALNNPAKMAEMPERIVFGVKNCDLSALQIHDYVLLKNEPVDPLYEEARKKTILVSCDCTDCLEVCFCTAVGEQPYPKEGFDINISKISQGYIFETGSEKGEKVLNAAKDFLKEAGEEVTQERDKLRQAVTQKVADFASSKGLNPTMDYKAAIAKSAEADLWDDFAVDCVECGACNFCCCTCHCFLLADGRAQGKKAARAKMWDSCLYRNFARVAGGANPRGHRAERLWNRFDKKFNFFPQVLGRYACDGCGRCIEACTGNIDIREILKRAVDES